MKEIISLGVKGGIWDLDLLFSSGWPWASYFSSAASVNRGHWSKCFQKSLYYDLHWRHIKISHHSPGQELTMSVHRQLHQIENSTTPAPHTLSSPWPTVQDTLNVLRLPQADHILQSEVILWLMSPFHLDRTALSPAHFQSSHSLLPCWGHLLETSDHRNPSSLFKTRNSDHLLFLLLH